MNLLNNNKQGTYKDENNIISSVLTISDQFIHFRIKLHHHKSSFLPRSDRISYSINLASNNVNRRVNLSVFAREQSKSCVTGTKSHSSCSFHFIRKL